MKKILYLECKTGAAGDMLMGALYSLLTEEQKVLFLEKLNAISEEVCVIPQEICKQGIGGIHMKVEIKGTKKGQKHITTMSIIMIMRKPTVILTPRTSS